MSVTLRPAAASDADFLVEMLLEAANWDPERPPLGAAQAMAVPELAHYVEGWPRPTDFGVVAESEGRRIGAAWCRHFTGADPGYGFVAADVPEVSVAVVADHRGQGLGTLLLDELHARARQRDTRALSLSVERANPAMRLYERLGYRTVTEDTNASTMVLELGSLRST